MSGVGIDLGTTNSLVALWEGERARVLPNAHGQLLTPSVVGLDDDGSIIVGVAARDRLRTHPERTTAAFKRLMGTGRTTRLGERVLLPEELSALVLRSLKSDAEATLGRAIGSAVISVPAYFNDAQRRATHVAAQLAGLKVERLVNEPTAAALAYGLHERREGTFLVFDLGGGTFDVSILESFEGVMEVHACAGDAYLGGEDFLEVLVALVAASAGMERDALDPSQVQRLRAAAELAKLRLSSHETADVRWPDGRSVAVTRAAYATACEPLLARLRAPCERALRDAKLRSGDIDAVILVGGATRKPMVRSLVARLFRQLPVIHVDPDQTVAMGAAIQSALVSRDAALQDIVLTDVTSYSVGISIVDRTERDVFMPVIERNSTVPISRRRRIQPRRDGQQTVHIGIYQGESRRLEDNVLIGELDIPLGAGSVTSDQIDVRFTQDNNGILEVEVTCERWSAYERLVITRADGALSADEIERRLAALTELKMMPRDRAENRAIMARADRLYQESLGPVRERVGELIAAFEAALAVEDPGTAAQVREAMTAQLDAIDEDSRWT